MSHPSPAGDLGQIGDFVNGAFEVYPHVVRSDGEVAVELNVRSWGSQHPCSADDIEATAEFFAELARKVREVEVLFDPAGLSDRKIIRVEWDGPLLRLISPQRSFVISGGSYRLNSPLVAVELLAGTDRSPDDPAADQEQATRLLEGRTIRAVKPEADGEWVVSFYDDSTRVTLRASRANAQETYLQVDPLPDQDGYVEPPTSEEPSLPADHMRPAAAGREPAPVKVYSAQDLPPERRRALGFKD